MHRAVARGQKLKSGVRSVGAGACVCLRGGGGLAAFNGISFRLNLPIFTKFRCGSLIGRNSFLSVISPYFDFVLILTCRVSGWRRQRQQFNSDNDSDIISDEQRATRPKRGHLRLVACRKRCIQEVGLRKEVPRDDTAAQGVRYPVLLPCLPSAPSIPSTPPPSPPISAISPHRQNRNEIAQEVYPDGRRKKQPKGGGTGDHERFISSLKETRKLRTKLKSSTKTSSDPFRKRIRISCEKECHIALFLVH